MFFKFPVYKEDHLDYALANMNKLEFSASQLRLSRSDEDNFYWVNLDIRSGIDEKQVLDGPHLFDTETTDREEQATRWLLERGIQIKECKASVAARQIDLCLVRNIEQVIQNCWSRQADELVYHPYQSKLPENEAVFKKK